MDLKDKIVVVTGSTRGLGYAIAESLLEAGATVVISGRTSAAVERAIDGLKPRGRVTGFVLDVHEEKQVYTLVQNVVDQLGRIDVWINNAGYSNAAGAMLEMDPQDALDMFLSNDLGLFYCTQAVMQIMLPRRQGLLVNIYGNGSFLRPATPTGLYGATKAWVTSFTRSLAKEIKGTGVQVLGFSPGMLLTDMLTSPAVVGERGREMLKNFAFVLRLLAKPPKTAADALVKAIAGNHSEFAEVRLIKPWTPLFGMLQIAWENLTKTAQPVGFELHYRVPYRSKFLPLLAKSK